MKGIEAINKAIADDLSDPAFKLTFHNDKTDVASSGDLAYTTGTYTVSYAEPKTKKVQQESRSYVTVFRKQADGQWKAVAGPSRLAGRIRLAHHSSWPLHWCYSRRFRQNLENRYDQPPLAIAAAALLSSPCCSQ